MKLTNTIINDAVPKDKPYKLSDGGGMYLYVMPNNSKYWRFKYRYANKEKTLALGVYPDVSIKDARNRLLEARRQLANNSDPSTFKKETKQQTITDQQNTFHSIALEWYSKNSALWDGKYRKTLLKRLEADLFPKLGYMPIKDITAPELLKTLRIVESRSIDTAHRLLQICSSIFKYAIVTGRIDSDIASGLRGALATIKKEHYASLSERELPQFLLDLNNHENHQVKLALTLLILTFVRSAELRSARWEEIDWNKREWRIPGKKMKMKELHIVPLSNQAIDILIELKNLAGESEYVLPGKKGFMSENILLHALYDLGYKGKTTIHGFRATASTILNEHGFHPDVIERQLAHSERNKVRAAYNHAQYLPERRKMMQWFSDFIDQKSSNNVIYAKFA